MSRAAIFNDVYTACSHLSIRECLCYRKDALMTRWLPRDLVTTPLRRINEEISAIEKKPLASRTVADVDRLSDLHAARRRIAGSDCGLR